MGRAGRDAGGRLVRGQRQRGRDGRPGPRRASRRIDAFQWHYYTFGLPEGGIELATSPAARQAFRLGDRVWGIQFHAEVERDMLAAWFGEGREELAKPIDEVWAETDRLLETWNRHGQALCNAFLDEARRIAS